MYATVGTQDIPISIQFCRNCSAHSFFTRHNEARYRRLFESFKQILNGLGLTVLEEEQARIGAFEIHLGRYVVYSKLHSGSFPNLGRVTKQVLETLKLYQAGYLGQNSSNTNIKNPQKLFDSPARRTIMHTKSSKSFIFTKTRACSAKQRSSLLMSPVLQSSPSKTFFSGKKFKKQEYVHIHKPESILYGDRKIPNLKIARPSSAGPPESKKIISKAKSQHLKTEPTLNVSYRIGGDSQMSKSQITAKLMKMIMDQEGHKLGQKNL